MTYYTHITRKGQVTIPKEIRDALKLQETGKLSVEFSKKEKAVKIKPTEDFLEVAKKIQVKRKTNPVKTRELMEKHYERK